MVNDEDFRFCIYCGIDCFDIATEHADDCPIITRLFPVREEDVLCPGCQKTYLGMCCSDCGDEFKVGDTYTYRKIEDGEIPTFEVVCCSCAVLDREIETR